MLENWIPKRPLTAHKGSNGRIYILAGSRGMVGAGILSSIGAVSSGAGLVRLGTVKSQQTVVAKRGPLEVTTDGLPEDKSGHLDSKKFNQIRRAIEKFAPDVLAVGPGLGLSKSTVAIVHKLLKLGRWPMVLDADGLNAVAEYKMDGRLTHAPLIMTPHPGELARLLSTPITMIQKDREASAKYAAKKFGCCCLLKGHRTLITDGHSVWRNTSGNPKMASAGMGDVLTGIIAAFWGQMPEKNLKTGTRAAVMGAYVHGRAGDIAAKRSGGFSIQASKLEEFIPQAINRLKGGSK